MKLNLDDLNVTSFSYQSRENRFVESSASLTGVDENLPRFSEFLSHVDITWQKKISKKCR
jgi:hypothetical protein